MNKKFKFKLSGLLKLKEFKEDEMKLKVAKILKEIERSNTEIEVLNRKIEENYSCQEELMKSNTQGRVLNDHSRFIEKARGSIYNKKKYVEKLKEKYDKNLKEMRAIMGDIKVLKKMESEKKMEHKKKVLKKMEEDIEEIINIRNFS